MAQSKKETYYDVLKVDRKATMAEIVAAYHTARSAFSRDSVATYSLFSTEDTQQILARLDEAYHVLSNADRKRTYDERLKTDGDDATPAPGEKDLLSETAVMTASVPPPAASPEVPVPSSVTGTVLRTIREQRQLSVEDVARITKIPSKFIDAIEREKVGALPARVYLQGFVKNLATLYRLDPKKTVEAYLEGMDRTTTPVVLP